MIKTLPFICLLIFLCLNHHLFGQSNKRPQRPSSPFNAGFIIGINGTQLDGDYQAGYDKIGFSGGIKSTIYLNPFFHLGIDMLYSQRGSKPGDDASIVDIHLNYIETNFLLNILASRNTKGLPEFNLQIGMAYARLLNYRIKEIYQFKTGFNGFKFVERSSYSEMAEFFKTNDLGIVAGVSLDTGPQFSVSFRMNFSITPLFDLNSIPGKENQTIQSYFFAIHGTYLLTDPYKRRKKR